MTNLSNMILAQRWRLECVVLATKNKEFMFEKLLMFICMQEIKFILDIFLDKILQPWYFGYFVHV